LRLLPYYITKDPVRRFLEELGKLALFRDFPALDEVHLYLFGKGFL